MAAKNHPTTPHHAMVIDTSRCIGCWACAVGCKQVNNEPLGFWWNRVLTTAPNQSTALKEPASENIDVPWGSSRTWSWLICPSPASTATTPRA